MKAPLTGIRVIEFEGIGPGPFAGRMLADMGAAVTAIVRPRTADIAERFMGAANNPQRRGKTVVVLDLKTPAGKAEALARIGAADALIEGHRPGVMERLGLGPRECGARTPRLVYGRMTGWGQTGPLSQSAGHDLNYVALTGLLSLSARNGGAPMVPPTVLGDASGALALAFGIVCALFDARVTGQGRVVDAAIVDAVAMLGSIALWLRSVGDIDGSQPSAFHDSPFYDVYVCADGRFITLAALEPQFFSMTLQVLGFSDVNPASQYDRATWPALKQRLSSLFASQPLTYWRSLLEGTDACFAPVLSIAEAIMHPHNTARSVYRVDADGVVQAAPAPRFLPLVPD